MNYSSGGMRLNVAPTTFDLRAQGGAGFFYDGSESSIRSSGGSRLNINNSNATTFVDGRGAGSRAGIQYSIDYSTDAGATSTTLITKGYADAFIAGQDTDTLVQNPTVSENGFVIAWNNANAEYELVANGGGGAAAGAAGIVQVSDGAASFVASAVVIAAASANIQMGESGTAGTARAISVAGSQSNIDLNLTAKGTGNIGLGNFLFDADQTVGAGQDNYVLTYDNGTGLISLEVASAAGVTVGAEDRIPISNSGSTDFDYTNDFRYVDGSGLITGISTGSPGTATLNAFDVTTQFTASTPSDGFGTSMRLGVDNDAGDLQYLTIQHRLGDVTATSEESIFAVRGQYQSADTDFIVLTSVSGVGSIPNNQTLVGVNASGSSPDQTIVGFSAEGQGQGWVSIGANAGSTSSVNTFDYVISIGEAANGNSSNAGLRSIAIGNNASTTVSNAILIGSHSSEITNALASSFQVNAGSSQILKVGTTLGLQVISDTDPDTNLTDAVNGVIAYDSTGHEFRAYVNGGWTALGSGGGSVSFGLDNEIPVTNSGATDFDYSANFTYDGTRLLVNSTGTQSIAIGPSADAQTTNSIAIGNNAGISGGTVNNTYIAIGDNAGANIAGIGIESVMIGQNAYSSDSRGVAIGDGAASTGVNAISIGAASSAIFNGVAIGPTATVSANRAIAIGAVVTASGSESIAIGRNMAASTSFSVMIGGDASTVRTNSLANSFEVNIEGTTILKTGTTLGLQVMSNANPDSNLTNAVNGVIAYDSTDHEFRAYVDGSWTALGSGGGSIGGATGVDFNDDVEVRFGTGNDATLEYQNSGNDFVISVVATTDIVFKESTTNRFVFDMGTGEATAVDWVATSDERLKDNWMEYGSVLPLVKELKGSFSHFKWKSDDRADVGYSAQQIRKFFPELVNFGERYLGLSYGKLSGIALEAIAEESDRAEAKEKELELKIEELEKKLHELRN